VVAQLHPGRAGANRFGRSLGDGGVGEALRDERQAGRAIDDFRLRVFDWQFVRDRKSSVKKRQSSISTRPSSGEDACA
jgi:hypothetical protein